MMLHRVLNRIPSHCGRCHIGKRSEASFCLFDRRLLNKPQVSQEIALGAPGCAAVPAADLCEVCFVLRQALSMDFFQVPRAYGAVERARARAYVIHFYGFDLFVIVIECQVEGVLAANDRPVFIHHTSLPDPEEITAVARLAHTHRFLVSFSRAEFYPGNLPRRAPEIGLFEKLNKSLRAHSCGVPESASVIIGNRYPQAAAVAALVAAELQKFRSLDLTVIPHL
jgi:hypothetical protein